MRFLIYDYETRSEADLKAVGGWEYSVHPTTEIMCVSWRLGTKEELRKAPVQSWDRWRNTKRELDEFIALVTNPSIRLVAHNAFFENVITNNVLLRGTIFNPIPPSRFICTAARAAALALPRDLEGACKALKIDIQKDMDGRALMLKMTKPRRPSKNDNSKWREKPEDIKRLVEYCEADILAETEIFLRTPALSPMERKVWELDQKINLRGVWVDRELASRTLSMVNTELKNLNDELRAITDGTITSAGQTARIAEFTGVPDVKAKTVNDLLNGENDLTPEQRRVLEIRRDASKTSTAKYTAFLNRTKSDSTLRDTLLYHGASTGRWTGRGVQVQNFPSGRNISPAALMHVTRIINEDVNSLELLRLLYGNPMDLFSANLRSVLIAPLGQHFFSGDYASIEVRVLFWIANHEEGLTALREGRDLYRELAVPIYNTKLEAVTKPQREIAKRAVLGMGFGMGFNKFGETCEAFNTPVTEEVAQKAVRAYRDTHAPVVQVWYNLERAAIQAVKEPGKRFTVNRTTWFVEGRFLWCELPSGRKLAYAYPTIKQVKTPWGEMRAKLYHGDIIPGIGKWVKSNGTYGGKLTENVVQAIARDLMADAMLRLEDDGFEVRLSVHDELVTTSPEYRSLEHFEKLMAKSPKWAEGLPVKVEGWKGPRYGKN